MENYIQNIAEEAAYRYEEKQPGVQEVTIDPTTITLFIGIVTGVIKLFKICSERYYANRSIQEVAYNPTLRERRLLNRVIRQKTSWWQWWWHGREIRESVLETGQTLSEEELDAIVNQ